MDGRKQIVVFRNVGPRIFPVFGSYPFETHKKREENGKHCILIIATADVSTMRAKQDGNTEGTSCNHRPSG